MELPKGIRAVVTGAGSGLGRAFAKQIAAPGGVVVASDVDGARAEETAREIGAAGGRAFAVQCDVGDVDQVRVLADEAERKMGGVDLVVNNAGVAVGGPFEEIAIADWRWIVAVNLWGPIHGCHVFYPRLKAKGTGYIINVASAAGLLSPPEMAPYNVTKAGVIALSETLHAEAKEHGVHVTVLCPTFFPTHIADNARGPISEESDQMVRRLMERSRLQADDVADAALAAVVRNRLYAVPMADGKAMWAAKRLAPGRFHGAAAQVIRRMRAKRDGG